MAEGLVGEEESDGQQSATDDEPADALGRDVEHHQHRAEDQQRSAEVLFENQHADADDPDHQDRSQVAGARELHAEEMPTGRGEQIALGDQHRGEEDDQQNLREFARLHTQSGQPNPDLGAVGLGIRPGQQCRNRQCDKADQP